MKSKLTPICVCKPLRCCHIYYSCAVGVGMIRNVKLPFSAFLMAGLLATHSVDARAEQDDIPEPRAPALCAKWEDFRNKLDANYFSGGGQSRTRDPRWVQGTTLWSRYQDSLAASALIPFNQLIAQPPASSSEVTRSLDNQLIRNHPLNLASKFGGILRLQLMGDSELALQQVELALSQAVPV